MALLRISALNSAVVVCLVASGFDTGIHLRYGGERGNASRAVRACRQLMSGLSEGTAGRAAEQEW